MCTWTKDERKTGDSLGIVVGIDSKAAVGEAVERGEDKRDRPRCCMKVGI
jgi:hypothetical protein